MEVVIPPGVVSKLKPVSTFPAQYLSARTVAATLPPEFVSWTLTDLV